MNDDNIVLQLKNISKNFGPTKALAQVSLNFYKGEIRGLIGENGSGKSTLCNVISGQLKQDKGEMVLKKESYSPENNVAARDRGISMIVQEMGTIDGLTVSENIFLGKEDSFKKNGLISRKLMNTEASKFLSDLNINIDPSVLVDELEFEERKLLEIARAMYFRPEILIVDETTTALSQDGRELLYDIIDNMKENNKTVIFISHDLDEVISKCDAISILRDGLFIDSLLIKNTDQNEIRSLMVGREIKGDYYRNDITPSSSGNIALECNNLYTKQLKNISLDVKWGEILGIAGLTDSGMREVGRIIFGLTKPDSGSVSICHAEKNKVAINNTKQAIEAKIGYVSKNRDKEALMLLSSIKENIVLPSLDLIKNGPFISPKKENKMAKQNSEKMEVIMRDIDQYAIHLSGGNKQKVVLAKWLANGSEILILDCPTRGIDVGVKSSIYQMMQEWKKEGKAIVMISEELPEVIGMSDRVLVFKNGEISKEFERSPEMTEQELIKYMI